MAHLGWHSSHHPAAATLDAIESQLCRDRRFRGKAPLSEAEHLVADFEAMHGIDLPWEYRCFLLRMGNAAPGLLPLGELPAAPPLQPRPDCPLDPYKTVDDYDEEGDPTRGTLPFTSSSPRVLLVISGPRRGQVLSFERETLGCDVLEHATEGPLGFFAWYATWLRLAEAHLETPRHIQAQRIVLALQGPEDALIEILEDVYTDDRRRLKAVVGLTELSAPSPTSLHALERATLDPSPRVRLEALRGQQRYTKDRFFDRAAAIVAEDSAPQVRRATVSLLEQHYPDPRCTQILRSALEDRDRGVALRALSCLLRRAIEPQDTELCARDFATGRESEMVASLLREVAEIGEFQRVGRTPPISDPKTLDAIRNALVRLRLA